MLRHIVLAITIVMLFWCIVWHYIISHTGGYGVKLPPILESLKAVRGETKLLSNPVLIHYESDSTTCLDECKKTRHCNGVIMHPDGRCKIFIEPSKQDVKTRVTYYDKKNPSNKNATGVPLVDNFCKVDYDCIQGTSCINGSCIPDDLNACKTWCDAERRCIGVNYVVSDNTSTTNAIDTKCIPIMEYFPGDNVEVINVPST